jgi:predicted Zn-dependent protease
MTDGGTPTRADATKPAARAVALVSALAIGLSPVSSTVVHAQSVPRGLPIIRDAEIEQLLREYSQPILRAAGLAQQNIQVTIINDRSFNAFVIDGKRIFINAGALMDAKTPNEVIGVLAHETGHIAGGHLARLRQQLANAQAASILAMLLGIGGAVAAARGGGQGKVGGNPAVGILGPQETIRRSML